MEGLQPTFDINGNNGNWGGTFVGAAIGGALGAAWNNGRWNNGNACGGNSCGCGCGTNYVMDTVTAMRSDVNAIGRDNLMQTAALQSANCQGFSGVNATVERVGGQLAQNQSRTEAAVYAASLQGQIQGKDNLIFGLQQSHAAEVQGMRNTYDLKASQDHCCCETNRNIDSLRFELGRQGCETRAAIKDCCCETQKAIHAEGEVTRALIAKIEREQLLREVGDLKSENVLLKNQGYTAGLIANAAQQNRNDMQGALTTILGHMAAFRQTDTAAQAA